jgi:hypothetical protein
VATFVEKEVSAIEFTQEFFGGWIITVEDEHLFLTRASAEDDISYVAIEHNGEPCGRRDCFAQGSCPKFQICCFGYCEYN